MRRRAVAALVALLALTACSTLPTDGTVRSRPDVDAGTEGQAGYFAPPGPKPGDSREAVVRGFLLAMQANPPSTTVARTFLSADARADWNPNGGTLVYDTSSVATEPGADVVQARLSDAHRLSPRGSWQDAPEPTERIDFTLTREGGEWRIDNPPDALAVPASYFPSLFVPFELYFFDRTGTVLVPTRVYLPRGRQTATNLVRGLIAGPSGGAGQALTTAFPSQADLDFGVLVSDAGVAEVPLGPGVLRLRPDQLDRLLAQLSWTLRQVPRINRIKLSVSGVPVPLPGDQADVGVRLGAAYDPIAAPDRDLLALTGGRVVRISGEEAVPAAGPLGVRGFALRSLALDAGEHRFAAVAANGRRLYLAPEAGSADQGRVVPVLTGTDLMRPVFDRFGRLWVIDRTARGAVVHLRSGNSDRVVDVPGVSGRRLSAFTLTRDGSRLVAAPAGGDVPRLVVVTLVRDGAGELDRAVSPVNIDVGSAGLGAVSDVGQVGGTTLAVLVQPDVGTPRIVLTEMDGSPGEPGGAIPDPARATGLAAAPDPALPLRAFTADNRLIGLDASGQWVRIGPADVRFAAYPD